MNEKKNTFQIFEAKNDGERTAIDTNYYRSYKSLALIKLLASTARLQNAS